MSDKHSSSTENFGQGDASFQAAGQEEGVRQLVADFYALMEADPRFTTIYTMHPADIALSADKLAAFLCGWLGGPRLYQQKFGSIGIPAVHRHLPITEVERDQWLTCMTESVAKQPYSDAFKTYLMRQFAVPANAIVRVCRQASGEKG